MHGVRIIVIVGLLTIFLLSSTDSHAKVLPRFQSSGGSSSTSARSYSGVSISPKFLPGRNGLRVAFGGLQYATEVSYMLTYETNGKSEGVTGSVKPGKISNMRFEVTSKLKSGKTSIKRYRIRV